LLCNRNVAATKAGTTNAEKAIFSEIDVLLDDLAPANGAFSYALAWASRLALPIQGIGVTSWAQTRRPANLGASPATLKASVAPTLASDGSDACLTRPVVCEAACVKQGVSWRYMEVPSEASIRGQVDSEGLLALSQTIPTKLKRGLLGTMAERPTLVCPSNDTRIGRMLILDHERDAASYLGAAVGLCHQIGAAPIVLTIARSMHAATERQQWAQKTIRSKGVHAEFDLLAVLEIRNTVLAIARWRRCQLVVMDCQQAQSWSRWLRGPEGFWTVYPTQSMAFLTLQEGAVAVPAESSADTASATLPPSRSRRP
jgi:hypothetical protein